MELHVERLNDALLVKTHLPLRTIRMPLAGHLHIVVFRVDDTRRASGFVSDESRHNCRNRGLCFLATKSTTHAFADADDLVHGDAQCLGHDRLNLSRVLGGRVNYQFAFFARNSQCRLRLEIKLLLAAPAPEPQFTGLQFASESEKYLAAIARFEPIVERYGARPSGRLAAFYLGICQSELGNIEAAIVALTQAADASEPLISGMALYRLGQLELGVGNADAAVEYFDRLLQLDGGFFPQDEALMAKARAQGDAGDPRAALATYQRVLRDYAGSYSEIEARTHVEEISAQLGLDPNVQSD